MILTHQLEFSYKGKEAFTFPDISCAAGETLLITGDSGKGKSTLLHLMGGLIKPDNGSVIIRNTDITKMNNRSVDRFRSRYIGIIFQQPHYIASLNLWENMMIASKWSHRKLAEERVEAVLAQLELMDFIKQLPGTLSIGQQQRLSIARALLNMPALLLADEPTSSLDDTNCFRVAETLNQLAKQNNSCLVIVTHDQRLKEMFPQKIKLL